MKLATLKHPHSRDGELLVVSRNHRHAAKATAVAHSLREAIENWKECGPQLEEISTDLNRGTAKGQFELDIKALHSPMPRSFQWIDGSAFLHHVRLVRRARNAEIPDSLLTTPLLYQGGGDDFLAPLDPIPQIDPSHGTDFEGEVGVIVDDVPMGVKADDALSHIQLLVSINDVSLRGLIPEELATGFGFFQSKPSTAFGPFAITPDELGEFWKGGRVHLPLSVQYNNEFFGNADAGQMHFHFGQIIAHAARTRNLKAGTIVGSGTVSNEDPARGSSCLVEKRMLEKINEGVMKTPFMKEGDTIKIEMFLPTGESLFGTIDQKVEKA